MSAAENSTLRTTTSITGNGKVDLGHFVTFVGKMNILITVINFICIISALVQPMKIGPKGWYLFVCIGGLISEIILTSACVFTVLKNVATRIVVWRFALTVFYILWALFYFIACGVLVHYARSWRDYRGWYASAVFGYLAVILYSYNGVHHYQDWYIVRSTRQNKAQEPIAMHM